MLKKIQFQGFKSFADNEEVEFLEGITGVVGPNGCGKSNIVDGVSFVLGAQSAKSLRGGKMEDVIFNGSDTRKAKDFAEVTLTLDNKNKFFKKIDSETVSVTRRVLRKGGSEYLINGEPSRLKDIQDIFMDTGVGTDSYSIIGQGQIGKILSTKLDERRAIFEEASGIVKLKAQKEQTEKRLSEVDNNLLRIEDIVNEIEKQLKPLKRQSEKAAEYNQLASELNSLETQYLVHEYDRLATKISEENEAIASLGSEITNGVSLIEEKESENQGDKDAYQQVNSEVFQFQSEISDIKEELEKTNGFVALNLERIENSKKQIRDISENLSEIEQKHSLSTEEFRSRQKRLSSLASILSQRETDLRLLEEQISTLESKKFSYATDIEHARKVSAEEYNELSQKNYEYEQLKEKLSDANLNLSSVNAKLEEMNSQKKTIVEEFNQKSSEAKSAMLLMEETRSMRDAKNSEINRLKEKYEENVGKVRTIESDYIKTKSTMESVEIFIENNEAFFEGVKSVLNAKKNGKFSAVIGVMADLLSVNKTFETAIDGLLQSSSQFIVTQDSDVVKSCIAFLKEGKLGKATFLPLDMANGASFDDKELRTIQGFQGINLALNAVKYDVVIKNAVSSLLGRTLIADSLDIALKFVKESKIKAKVATLDGELVQSGTISGGMNKNQKSNFFTKKRELDELKQRYVQLEKNLMNAKQIQETFKAQIADTENASTLLNARFEEQKNGKDEKDKICEEISYKLQRFEDKAAELEVDEKELKLSVSETKKMIAKTEFLIGDKSSHHKEITEKLEKASSLLVETEAELEKQKNLKNEFVLASVRLKDEEAQIKDYLNEFGADNESLEEKITKMHAKKEEEECRVAESAEQVAHFEKQRDASKTRLDGYMSKIETMHKSNQQLFQRIEKFEKEIKTLRIQKESLEKQLSQKEVSVGKCGAETANILSRLKEFYEIEADAVSAIERTNIDLPQSKKRVEEIKRAISALGNINHTAIEEFEKLDERYANEQTQFVDVKKAKEDLLILLKTVEDEMVHRFTATFDSIAALFAKTFVDLFEGGRAGLFLEEPNKPLTSAVGIKAQPPGKKPQSIDSLSGGEKAFTAVALILAIISSKPSPFVILDEVDAPLDDANVARFANYLRKFSDKSQFIIITHRKGTMMIADSIYGVTQQERGVSIIFPHVLDEISQKSS